jgi:TolA-binding protein
MGFLPDTDDRLRRLELAVAELAETWAEQLERQAALRERVEKMEKRLGAITSSRVSPWE